MALSPNSVHSRLRAVAIQFRWSRGARWLIAGTAASIFILFLLLIGDMVFHFGPWGRWIGFVAILSMFLAGIALAAVDFLKKVSDDAIARRIERSCGGSRNVLINAVQFDRELALNSPLRSALFQEMHDPFPGVRWGDVFDFDLLKKIAIAFLAAALALTAWGIFRPAYFANSAERILLPSSSIAPLTRTHILDIQPGNTVVSNGNQVVLKVSLGGEIPRLVRVRYRDIGSPWQKELLSHELGTTDFSFIWKDVHQPMEYSVEAGDAESDLFRIGVRPKTVMQSRSVEITPPAYTHLPKFSVKDFTKLQNVIPGSKVAFDVEFNNPVGKLKVLGENEIDLPVTNNDPLHWRFSGGVSGSEALNLNYTGTDGIADAETIQVEVKPDTPPSISISSPAEGSQIIAKRSDIFPVQFSISDDFGLSSVSLYKSSGDKVDARLVREWKEAGGSKLFQGQIEIPLGDYSDPEDATVTFCLIARDGNDFNGPGVTTSRPIVVQLKSNEAVTKKEDESRSRLHQGIEEILKLQETNLVETQAAITAHADPKTSFSPLLERQLKISDLCQQFANASEAIDPALRTNIRSLLEKEMRDSVMALRNTASSQGDAAFISAKLAMTLEATILARLRGATDSVDSRAMKEVITELIGGVEELLHKQRDIFKQTQVAARQSEKPLSDRQDALAEQAQRTAKQMETSAQNSSVGDKDFRARLQKAAAELKQFRIYEDMLTSADKIDSDKLPDSLAVQKSVLKNLGTILNSLNQWELVDAEKKLDEMKKAADEIKNNLAALAEIQKQILEKSRELARKSDFRPEDVATMKEIATSKELMAQAVEQMLKDGQIFPDVKQGTEMQTELTKIFEDVTQADLADSRAGKLKPTEIAVQKEDGILQAIENAKKIDEDQEMWLASTQNKTQWQLENFDKKEMPDMPMLTLPEEQEDLIGNLLEQQKGLADQVEDSAANQLMAENPADGNQLADGNQDAFGGQGKSGNERPKSNEQAGRSSGGRDGMSDGEMSGKVADNLEGNKAKVRRTRDAMQHGQVEDNGPEGKNLATGGGKSGGYSQQNGMDGDAPVKAVKAPAIAAMNAAAARQALLAEKTSKQYAQASLLYLKADGLSDISRLMDDSSSALKAGDMNHFSSLHRQIIAKLQAAKGNIRAGAAVILPGSSSEGVDKQVLGGDEGVVPEAYKKKLADYYRSLSGEK